MRPIKLGPYSPITALTTAYADQVTSTGAALTLAATAPTDSLAHLVTLTSAGGVDLSALAFAIVGTDNDGNPQTDTIAAGPNGSTVASAKYFKTVTSVTPSATMATKKTDIGIGAVSLSPSIPLEWRSIVGATHAVDVTGAVNFSVQETFDNIYNAQPSTLAWVAYTSGLTSKTATQAVAGTVGANAARLVTNSVTNNATLTWRIVQPTQQTG